MTDQTASSDDIEIRLEHVSKTFGRGAGTASFRAVDDLTLDIRRGEMVVILGKTGCGKSTMFNMVAGLGEPTEGRISVKGRDPFKEFDWFRNKIAIVFQNDRLLPWRSALENVAIGLEMVDMRGPERRRIAQDWLTRLGLAGHEHDYPYALSGGMRQRVSIARAFATDADILLCDEPFSALDELTAQRLRAEFADLVRENGKTAVLITHSINEALQMGDRIVVLKRPAKVAFDVKIDRDNGSDQFEAIRARIHEVLAI